MQDFSQGGGVDDMGPKMKWGLIKAGYTDREDLETFIWSKTGGGGEQGGGEQIIKVSAYNKGCTKRCIQETRDEIIKTVSDNKGFIDIRW